MGKGSEDPDKELKCCCYVFLIMGLVTGLIILIIYICAMRISGDVGGSYYGVGSSGGTYYRGGTSGGSYYGGSRLGGRGGGRGGCFSETSLVWTKNESQSDNFAQLVKVTNIAEGNLVGTLDISTKDDYKYEFSWTRATDVTIQEGDWKAHTFVFDNRNKLTVTSPHLMIIKRNGMMYFLRADNIQIGDEMIVNKEAVQILDIKVQRIKKKVAVETEDGTIQVNGVFASGLCDYNPDVVNRIVKFETYIKKYKSNHFGYEYRYKCMEREAWKKNYLINNAISY